METIGTTHGADVFRRVIEEGFNRGNFDAWDDCLPEQFIEHQYGLPATREGFKRSIAGLRRAVPDPHLTIDDLVTLGDMVWARMTARGTLLGFPPTGKSFAITVIDVCRIDGDRIVEHWGVPDRFALLDQLGMLPHPPAPTAG